METVVDGDGLVRRVKLRTGEQRSGRDIISESSVTERPVQKTGGVVGK